MRTQKNQRILVIPDTHAPFQHPRTLEFLQEIHKKYNCNRVIHLGDVADFHAFSCHPKEEESNGADELNRASEAVREMAKIFPDVDIIFGNHDVRIYKRIRELGLPKQILRSFNELIGAPKSWNWHVSLKVSTPTGLVIFEHGDGVKDAITAAQKNGCSTVCGHLHSKSSIEYQRNALTQFFGMQCGCLVDESSYGFKYARTMKSKNVYSCGVLINGVPYLEPLL